MRKLFLSGFAVVAMALAVGCQNKADSGMQKAQSDSMNMGTDQCSHCPGTQTAKADGTCPSCGMMLTRSNGK